jgi:D-arabinose 1-dehydrogenase-like Zn-dependent alcohol dehydrogenase
LISPALIILRQIKVIGSMAFRPWDIYEALDLLKRGLISPSTWSTGWKTPPRLTKIWNAASSLGELF